MGATPLHFTQGHQNKNDQGRACLKMNEKLIWKCMPWNPTCVEMDSIWWSLKFCIEKLI